MAAVKDILEFFETFAPVRSAMDFDNAGLLAGSPDAPLTKALVALDITPGVIEEAADGGFELIISHHPVIFAPLKRLTPGTAPYMLAERGIAAICMHTNLDLSESFGVNLCLANAIGVKEPRKSAEGECLFIGSLEAETPAKEFAEQVKESLGCPGLRYTAVKPVVKTVAVSSGAGGSEIFAAAKEGADVLVTGEIKHHEINAANGLGVNIIDAGHFKSEDVVTAPLVRKLSAAFPGIGFVKSKAYSDGIMYI